MGAMPFLWDTRACMHVRLPWCDFWLYYSCFFSQNMPVFKFKGNSMRISVSVRKDKGLQPGSPAKEHRTPTPTGGRSKGSFSPLLLPP